MTADPAALGRADVEPVQHEAVDRTITGLITVLPILALGVAVWWSWEGLLHPSDLIVVVILSALTGLGTPAGFHRLLTRRSFKTGPVVGGVLAVLGSAAIEGPAISWV